MNKQIDGSGEIVNTHGIRGEVKTPALVRRRGVSHRI